MSKAGMLLLLLVLVDVLLNISAQEKRSKKLFDGPYFVQAQAKPLTDVIVLSRQRQNLEWTC